LSLIPAKRDAGKSPRYTINPKDQRVKVYRKNHFFIARGHDAGEEQLS